MLGRDQDEIRTADLPSAVSASGQRSLCAAAGEVEVSRAEVKQQPDVTLAELCERVAATHQVVASSSMMSRALQQLKLGRKKRPFTTVRGTRRA